MKIDALVKSHGMGVESTNPEAKKLAVELEELLTDVLNDENHMWSIGKENIKAREKRVKRRNEFLEKYE